MYGDGPPFDCLEIGGRRVELGPLSADDARSRMGSDLFGDGPFSVWFEEVGVGDLEDTGLSYAALSEGFTVCGTRSSNGARFVPRGGS